MSSPDWQELEKLWQSSNEPSKTKELELVKRLHRWPWLRRVTVATEVVLVVIMVVLSFALMQRKGAYALPFGVAFLVLALFTGGVTFWARRTPGVAVEASVTAALDTAIHRVRIRTRLALATFWVIAAMMFFYAFMAFMWLQADTYTTQVVHRHLTGLGILCVWAGICQVGTILYYQRRLPELLRLEEIRRGLKSTL